MLTRAGLGEQGKAGGHEPPLFPLPGHILAFFSSGSHELPLFPLSWRSWIFENHPLKVLNILFKKVVLPGRVKCGGTENFPRALDSYSIRQNNCSALIFFLILAIEKRYNYFHKIYEILQKFIILYHQIWIIILRTLK